jgi:hypothetical protein
MTQWMPPHQMQHPGSLAQGGRASWDYAYSNPSAATGIASAAQPLQRSDLATDISQMSADNTYPQYGERTTRV